ncbi:MAG: nucleotidyl transferase AbiEii/AbiGii toxin family protein, partial [Candidatus Omnitrophica bacterium]|nr:nucleotidyl transferase AbiEii/AbiGii toxin family protein [Candidatus Omnitrophota bacterium]
LIHRYFIFSVAHFDLPSLYATKLCACFFRKYVKGRDFYDLLWYLTKKIEPNYRLLNSAINQIHKSDFAPVNRDNFREFLGDHLVGIDFTKVKKDVERFLEDKGEVHLINKKSFLRLLDSIYLPTQK